MGSTGSGVLMITVGTSGAVAEGGGVKSSGVLVGVGVHDGIKVGVVVTGGGYAP